MQTFVRILLNRSRLLLQHLSIMRQRRFAEVKTALETVPLGLLSWKHLLIYIALAPFFPKPAPRPVPPVESYRPDRPAG